MSSYVFPVLGGGSITSGFGQRRSGDHRGIDIGGATGTPIVATTGGQRVTKAYTSNTYGNVVYTVDQNSVERRYAHLNGYNVKSGDVLGAGQQLGTLGSTGRSSGPHLHYEERDRNGKAINPASLLSKAKALVSSDVARAGLAAATGGASEAVFGVTDGLGITGSASWLDQFKSWLADSGFFQRLALAAVALILIVSAFYLLKSNAVSGMIEKAKDAVT